MTSLSPVDLAKSSAAQRAVLMVEDGMKVGLGTGSTAVFMVKHLAERVRQENLSITAVATSESTAALARAEGLTVVSLDEAKWLNLTIDGADEFDDNFNLIKGGGGALLVEKIVATASDRVVIIADPSKEVDTLGAFPLPIEVIPFGWQTTKALVEETLVNLDVQGRDSARRMNGDTPFLTDNGNYILDLQLKKIANARRLSLVLNQVPGIVENGLFIDIADVIVVGAPDGSTEIRDLTPEEDPAEPPGPSNIFSNLVDG
ncbi:MAG: ribose-5-phosphate isomerase RpiA [Pseudomonadota bacterium]